MSNTEQHLMEPGGLQHRGQKLRVALLTEGTYPYVVGGVSSWCQNLITEIPEMDWDVIPITAGGLERQLLFDLPPNAVLHEGIDLWGPRNPRPTSFRIDNSARREAESLPVAMTSLLFDNNSNLDELAELFARLRAKPSLVREGFRSKRAWEGYLEALAAITGTTEGGLFSPVTVTALDAATTWQSLYWLATSATIVLPEVDVVISTAAGWPTAMAAAARVNEDRPVIQVEHGLYVREAYLESVRNHTTAGQQFSTTGIASGLARLAYHIADRIAPVCDGHRDWELLLGADPDKIQTIYNGVEVPDQPAPPVFDKTVVIVGRIDPLKDIASCLRAARYVCDVDDEVRFLHYGPATEANRSYAQMCMNLHRSLGLGDRFTFMGPTADPSEVMKQAAIAVSSSISEGLPLSVMESMAQARPVVATNVGGCADLLSGCGILVPAGDAFALGSGIKSLLDEPRLAADLGLRGYRRAIRRFSTRAHIESYRRLIHTVARGRTPELEPVPPVEEIELAKPVRLPERVA